MADLTVRDRPPYTLGDSLANGEVIVATENAEEVIPIFGSERVRVIAKVDAAATIEIVPYRSNTDKDGNLTLTLIDETDLADLVTELELVADTEATVSAESIGDFAFALVRLTAGAGDVTIDYIHISQT